jgi:hypothetical protein
MDSGLQDSRLSSPDPFLERRSSRKQIVQNNRLYGLELSDATLQVSSYGICLDIALISSAKRLDISTSRIAEIQGN